MLFIVNRFGQFDFDVMIFVEREANSLVIRSDSCESVFFMYSFDYMYVYTYCSLFYLIIIIFLVKCEYIVTI